MLELKDATLTLEGRELFRGLSLMALDGQLTCITGRAGVGKTAIIQVMLGFVLLDDGLVSIDGELLTPLSAPVFRKLRVWWGNRKIRRQCIWKHRVCTGAGGGSLRKESLTEA